MRIHHKLCGFIYMYSKLYTISRLVARRILTEDTSHKDEMDIGVP